jgi:hypothetical protein
MYSRLEEEEKVTVTPSTEKVETVEQVTSCQSRQSMDD